MSDETPEDPRPGHGVLVRARNGEVIRYDPSGLVMRLSDKVIADIALRLGGTAAPSAAATQRPQATRADPHEHLEGVDAWDLRIEGDWLHFTAHLPGRQGVRGFRRPAEGGAILADAPGPLFGLLGLGGPRATRALPRRADFPQHILAPADDIGAVGHADVEEAARTDRLEQLREMTQEALVAEVLLGWQMEKHEALPLFVTRVETASAGSVAELAESRAPGNLLRAAENLAAAATMGKRAQVLAVCLDYGCEDVTSDAAGYRDGMLALMARIEEGLARLGFDRPVFVTRLDGGAADLTRSEAIEGQWELGWNHGAHRLVHSAPGYMFALDAHDRPTEAAMVQMAEMTALAISDPETWLCPRFHLAETDPADPRRLRAVARAMTGLRRDTADPFGAGAAAGFRLLDAGRAEIAEVAIDPEDAQTVLLTLTEAPPPGARLAYAWGAEPGPGPYAANCGAIRDDWGQDSLAGGRLHRWALPVVLPIHMGAGTRPDDGPEPEAEEVEDD